MQKTDADDGSKINSASLIDLKAELFRKQEEYKAQKLANQNAGYIKSKPSSSQKKPSVWNKKNKGVSERAEKDYEEKVEEENIFEQSKKSLENKARLYDKIANSREVPEEDGSNFYLVDFQKKVIDDREERKKRETLEEKERKEAEEERRLCEQPIPEPETPDEEWVDFTDSLGRSRRCLRADLPSLQQRDQEFYQSKIVPKEKAAKDFQELRDKTGDQDLMSKDMLREKERQKWEEEEEAKMKAETEGPIHYGDVLHNEIRTHGVAFYKFDTDEDKRQKQMDELMKMRQETKDERSKSERIKAKRKAALAARLAKVKQRKREKLGLPEEEEEKVDSDEEIGPKLDEAVKTEKEPELLTRDDEWRKNMENKREWDKGKQNLPERSEQAWLEKQRSERFDDFAPPSFYYSETRTGKQTESSTFSATFGADGKRHTHPKQTDPSSSSSSTVHNIVEKQLNEMRTQLDQNSESNLDQKHPKTNSKETNLSENMSNVSEPQLHHAGSESTCNSLYMTPPPGNNLTNVLPVNVNVPPPPTQGGMPAYPVPINPSIPPPPLGHNISATPPVNYAPPPQLPFNMSVPPPPLPNQAQQMTPMSSSMAQPLWNINYNQPMDIQRDVQTSAEATPTSNSSTNPVPTNERQKFIPRMNVLDTRFMESD